MSRYGIIDVANLFYRCRHAVKGDAYTKAGMALTIVFRSLRKMAREQKVDHFVFATEARSWRYDVYPQYKAKRKLERLKATPAEQEEEEAFMVVMNDFQNYIAEKTRCTVLQSEKIEGDDWVAHWIACHPKDDHIILSGDSDFVQLLAPNVSIYNGVDDRLMTIDGVFDGRTNEPMVFSVKSDSGKISVKGTIAELKAKHEKEQKAAEKAHIAAEKERMAAFNSPAARQLRLANGEESRRYVPTPFNWEEFIFTPEPEWWRKALFVKLIRGDVGDSIFSAYPGVRFNGSSKKVGISEAWEDRRSQGYFWNNFFLSRWSKLEGTDPDGNSIVKDVTVREQFELNESLIDLTKQPKEIKELMTNVIIDAVQKEPVGNVGIHFLRFCDKNFLPQLAKEATDHAAYLNAPYAR